MVYHDYDEEDHAFDDHDTTRATGSTSNTGSVSVGRVGDKARAGRLTLCLRKKCFGVPVVLLMAVVLVALIVTGLVASKSGGSDGSDETKSSASGGEPQSEHHVVTRSPTRAPTPHPTLPTKPTPAPSQYPTHQELSQGTDWVQMGNDVGGISSAEGNFGISVGVSGNGHVFAEGAHMAIGKDATTGHVRVFHYNKKTYTWELRGSELTGEKHGDEFGYSIDLSRSGDQIAIGAPGADRHTGPDHGYFAVYRWNTTIHDWSRMGPDKWGVQENERAGTDVTISEDGGILVIGAPGNSKMGKASGEIRVFAYMEKTDRWLRRGQDLHGEAPGDQFGFSVAVSDSGEHVAAGSPFNDNAGENAGSIRVFAHSEDGRYHKLSRTLTGRDPGDNFGYSVACSKDCKMVAGGAPSAPLHLPGGEKKQMAGYVEVHKYDAEENKWHKVGHPIYGEYAYEGFGKSVELSGDGHTLLVGSPDVKNSRGAIRVFQYQPDQNEWVQIGKRVQGDGEYDFWGSEVAASEDGRIIVSGGNNFNGLEKGTGHVRVYRGV